MHKYAELFEYFRQCPQLSDMMGIASEAKRGNTVILPQGASPAMRYEEFIDSTGQYNCDIIPYESVYEDFQINCYKLYDVNDTTDPHYNINVMTYEEVCAVCDWIQEQDEKTNFPNIGEEIISLECFPFVPQVGFVDADSDLVGYFITVRVRYINRRKPRSI